MNAVPEQNAQDVPPPRRWSDRSHQSDKSKHQLVTPLRQQSEIDIRVHACP